MEPEPNLEALLDELLTQWDEQESTGTGESAAAAVEESLAALAAAQADTAAPSSGRAVAKQDRQARRNGLLDMVRAMHAEIEQRNSARHQATRPREGYVLFRLGEAAFGIPISQVAGADRLPRITAMPFVPAYVRGLVNRRGEILPLIDLRLATGNAAQLGEGRMLVVKSGGKGTHSGFVVDRLEGIAWIEGDQMAEMEAAPEGSPLGHWLRGVVEGKGRKFGVVDLKRLFSSSELSELFGV
jgi:purine-binding chemotaxis protein CheW